jgi:hypothetical protein
VPDVIAIIENQAPVVEDDGFSKAFDQLSAANDEAKGEEEAAKITPVAKVETPAVEELPPDDAQKAAADAAAAEAA